MLHTTFAPAPLRTSGPADESSDDEDDRPHHGRTLPRTPFPNIANLGSPSDDDDEEIIVPGGRPRSRSNPGPYPGIAGHPGSAAFGSPDGSQPVHMERGPYRPPHPASQPRKSALRSSRRATMDYFGSPGVQSPPMNGTFPAGMVPQPGMMSFQSPPPNPPNVAMMPNGGAYATMPRSRGMQTPMVPQPSVLPASHAHQSRGRIPMQVSQPPIRNVPPQAMGQPPPGMPMPVYQNGMPPPTPGYASMAAQMIPIATPGYSYVPASAAGGQQWQPGHPHHERNAKRHRKSRKNRRRDESESESESVSEDLHDDSDDGHERSRGGRGGSTNPLPQPPRIMPIPEVNPNDAIRVDSPPAPDRDAPALPPKPPPNPLPVPPKQVIGEGPLAQQLAAAAEEVKRAKQRTELAREKAIQRLEADTYRAAGVPIGGDEENPVVPLIAGVTVPGVLPTASAAAEEKKNRRKHPREPTRKLANGRKDVTTFANLKSKRRNGGEEEEESPGDDGDEEEEGERGDGHHNSIAAGIGSLLKRISTRNRPLDQNGTRRPPPPPPPPKPAPKRQAQRPQMPTHNSYDMPREEGIVPRSARRATMDDPRFRTQPISAANAASIAAAANGNAQYPFVQRQVPGAQLPMQYDPSTQEYYDPTNGLWWNPNTRKYYQKRVTTTPAAVNGKHRKEGSGNGLVSMLKRWTTNTAPDHQPKPITAQLVMPGGVRRKSTQQPPITVLADHPHAAQQGPRRRTLSASDLSGTGGKNAPWYHPSSNRRAANRMTAESGAPPWGYQGSNGHEYPMHAQSEMHLPQEMFGPSGRGPAANIYFSRKRDPYGAFRLDSEHPVSWAGIEAPTALHWYESGRFEHVGKGLGTMGMQTGWTRPSTQPLPSVGRRSGSRIGQASKMLKGLLGKNNHGLKESRLEFARAHTEASDAVLRARTSRELMRLVTQNRMEGYERNDWMMIYRSKLDEILFLKFTQHDELGVMLLNTGFAPIIFNNHDPELGDGGDANVASNNGRNELGYSLMRVREMLRQRMDAEREGDYGGEDEDDE